MTETTRDPQGPPKDIDASELWLALTAIPLPHEVVDFPVKDPVMGRSIAKVAIVPLAPEELWACRKLAWDYAAKYVEEKPEAGKESSVFKEIMGDEATVQILYRALRDPNDKTLDRRALPAPAVMRRKPFTGDILGVLLKMYLTTCVKCGPIVATMTEDEIKAWLDALEEGAAAFPFEVLSLGMLTDLLQHSVARCKVLRTGNGSRGPQPSASSNDSNPQTLNADAPPTLPPNDLPPVLVADEPVIG